MTKSYQSMVFAVLLLGVVVLFSLGYLVEMLNGGPFPSHFFFQIRPYMVGLTLRSRDWVFGIRVERTVSYIYLTYWVSSP